MTEAQNRGRRSSLAVPASDSKKISKALESGADELVLDLEDAVAPGDKERARDLLATFDWPDSSDMPQIAVRVNAPRTPWCHRDVEVVASAVPAASIVLPKVDSRADIGFIERLIDGVAPGSGLRVHALIETAAGLARLGDIVSAPERLSALIIGYADLAASLGRKAGFPDEGWSFARELLLTHARAAGLQAIDGPHLGIADDDTFRAAVSRSATSGFDAKWVIHPQQVAWVNREFTPSAEEIEFATAVLEALEAGHAAGAGAVQLDGQLVDEAMAVAARRVLGKVSA
jgi:citrate lyase subunit beta/citryl-CoA lyase